MNTWKLLLIALVSILPRIDCLISIVSCFLIDEVDSMLIDESSKIARAGVKLSEQGELTQGMQEFKSLGERVSRMVNMALDAFARYDAESALQVAKADARVDDEYSVAMRSMITYMMEDPHSISSVLNVLWALRALERIGDHAKNISEHVIYLVQGTDVRHEDLDKIARKVLTPE